MTRPALYLDENVTLDVVAPLQGRGFTVATAHSANLLGASDAQHLLYATREQSLLATHDANDYRRLHLRQQPHGGILLVPTGPLPRLIVRIALSVDWIAAQGEHRSRLFRWNDVQQGLIAGERVAGYTEEEHRRALGQLR